MGLNEHVKRLERLSRGEMFEIRQTDGSVARFYENTSSPTSSTASYRNDTLALGKACDSEYI
jgi:hypothetical protein